jgi:deazaflavin-dependent oxidoreductase (nitroreductase family)
MIDTATLETLASEDFCYLTTTGRVTGKPHEIEIWFALRGRTLYMLSGGRDRSDWVRNIQHSPNVGMRISGHQTAATGRIVTNPDEDTLARRLVVGKYAPRTSDDLDEWGRTSLPVAVDL